MKPSNELSGTSAVIDDARRKAVDDAKKRAVAQNVDYDTFKNMVSVAHLRPIQAASTGRKDVSLPSWQYDADGTASGPADGEDGASASGNLVASSGRLCEPLTPPSSSGDFYRDWRRSCPTRESKYRYLRLCGPDTITAIFKVEVSCEVLKEILDVLKSCRMSDIAEASLLAEDGTQEEALFRLHMLKALQAAGRFSLTIKLAGSSTQPALASLFSQLEADLPATLPSASHGHSDSSHPEATHGTMEELAELMAAFRFAVRK